MITKPANEMPFRPSQLFTEDMLQLPQGTLLVLHCNMEGLTKDVLRFDRVLPKSETGGGIFGCVDGWTWFIADDLEHASRFSWPGLAMLRIGRKLSLSDKGTQSYGDDNSWNTTYWLEIASWDQTILPPHLAQKRRCSIVKSIRETTAVPKKDQLPSIDIVWGNGGKITPTYCFS